MVEFKYKDGRVEHYDVARPLPSSYQVPEPPQDLLRFDEPLTAAGPDYTIHTSELRWWQPVDPWKPRRPIYVET